MSQNQAVSPAPKARRYSFLSRVPTASQKKRPAPQPPMNVPFPLTASKPSTPTRSEMVHVPHRRSSTFTSIANWALAVHPGTPAPLTPRRASISSMRRLSVSARRSSMPMTAPPVDSEKDYDAEPPFDLTALGYNSVFVTFPYPPTYESAGASKHKRFPSLGKVVNPLRKRTKSVNVHTPSKSSKQRKNPVPPTLASELLLMQMVDGGSIEANARRVMESQAKQTGGPHTGIGEVFRDENGNVWWDREEQLEYVHLLSADARASAQWEKFTEERKESAASSMTVLDEARMVLPRESQDGMVLRRDSRVLGKEDLEAFKGKGDRKRPAPLNLDAARRSFLDNSFAPATAPARPLSHGAKAVRVKKRESKLNVRTIFGMN